MEDKSLIDRKITKGISALFCINSSKLRITPEKSVIPLTLELKQYVIISLLTPFEGIA